MKRTLCILVCLCYSVFAQADDFPAPNQQTSSSPNARFEILQSSLAARWTFRLDKYSGRVWQLVKTSDDDNAWEEMLVIGIPKTAARPHFQLFASSLAARYTFLIDNDTGKTWVVANSKSKDKAGVEHESNIWQPFAE